MSKETEKQAEAVAVLNSTLALHAADPDGVNVAIDLGRLRAIAAALNPTPEEASEAETETAESDTL